MYYSGMKQAEKLLANDMKSQSSWLSYGLTIY